MSDAKPNEEVQLLRHENAMLRAQLAWFQKRFYGGNKSEKLDPSQLKLSGVDEAREAVTEHTEKIAYERTKRREPRPTPAEALAHVPVTETVEIVLPAVRQDPELYEKIGEERAFETDVIPPKLVKREIVRPKYRHRLDRNRPPLLAGAPARVLPGGYASAGLIAWIVVGKYLDHLRLYRQEHQALLAGNYIQADETPVRCNDPDYERKGTRQCCLWVISRP